MSGLFAICMNLFLRARMEKEIDIVLEIKLARRSRPEFIDSTVRESQFSYCNGWINNTSKRKIFWVAVDRPVEMLFSCNSILGGVAVPL